MAKIIKKKKKGLKSLRSSGGSSVETSPLRPQLIEKTPPCINRCPNHNLIRDWLTTISQAEGKGKTHEQALEEAFYIALETTPFPAVCGRVCPHPCEDDCNRKDKDGSVNINKVERYIGDYGLQHGLPAKKVAEETRTEKVAVVGSGPAGLSCAYHLARRGYPVTVFEAFPKAGGMLRYGIPDYRLPADVLDGEIDRILDMGVELKLDTKIGKDISMDDLRKEYRATFVGIGAHQGLKLRLDGEDAENVWAGTDFLHKINGGEMIDVGDKVVVVGGGDTAIDAARVARRLGADVTILYRRTRTEMPAIDEEVEGAEEEGVTIELLAAPLSLHCDNGKATGMTCQRMELGEPDDSGRRRPVPIEGDTFDVELTTLIAAISQAPDFDGFENLREGKDWIKIDESGHTQEHDIFSGGDDTNLGLVVDAIAHGRLAAFAVHEMMTGEKLPDKPMLAVVTSDKMKLSHYDEAQRNQPEEIPVDLRLREMNAEIVKTMSDEQMLAEAARCMSCGMCFDCGSCWSYCQDNAVVKPLTKYGTYKFKLEFCNGCKKCAENCPCGYIEMH
ncbi:MAG: FAD-dependent oxidoreductase [candidate division Zixibacteria bacterium]|nr:FAD-dependent oxidoreductase [candidate division Zixibacteria bacterium]